MPAEPSRVLSRRLIAVGNLCALGIVGFLVETVANAAYAAALPVAASTAGIRFTEMHACPGLLGSLGGWAYLAAWAWLPRAVWRVRASRRDGRTLRPAESRLLATIALLIAAAPCALWLASRRLL